MAPPHPVDQPFQVADLVQQRLLAAAPGVVLMDERKPGGYPTPVGDASGKDPVFVADSGWGIVVSPNSKHQDIAWDFIKYATTDPANATQFNIASGTIPAMPAVGFVFHGIPLLLLGLLSL